ncbi:MAG: extracellular solute-binding protein [Acetatifactor sp.]|nr:extracellular solute-binding protein [Acetatifactor sp.]
MRKALYKKLIAGAMAALLALSMAACGKEQGQEPNSVTQGAEWVYVPEYISMEGAEDFRSYNSKLIGESLYYSRSDYQEEADTSTRYLCEYSLTDKKVVREVLIGEGNGYVSGFQVAEDGSLYVIDYRYNYTKFDEDGYPIDATTETIMMVFDSQGEQLRQIDLGDILSEEDYVRNLIVDGQNRLYLVLDSSVLLLDDQGAVKGKVELNPDSWLSDCGVGKDGKAYLTYYDRTSGTGGYVLAEIDYDARKLGTVYQNFPSGNSSGSLTVGDEDHDFLVSSGNGLVGYDLETQTSEELFQWIDCNINSNYVDNVGVLGDGRIVVMTRDWITDEQELAVLTKTDASTLPQKTEIVIATYSISQDLETQAVNFNKQSNLYHVTVKDYSPKPGEWTETSYQDALTAMNNDLTSSSNAPDIIDLSSVNIEQFAGIGVFEDLTPYLENSSVLDKDDYLENVLKAYTYDGVLVGIPFTFSLNTLAASAKDLGDEPGWTLEEMIAYSEAHPDAQLFDYSTKSYALNICLLFAQEAFIDWGDGTCSFDSEEFKNLLTFVEQFPDEYDWEADQRPAPEKISDGDLLLDTVYISEFQDIQIPMDVFEGGAVFIGYPTVDGSNGCQLYGSSTYGIVSKSDNKEGAWSFLEFYLNREAGGMFTHGLPSRESDLERLIKKATEVQYMTDENGEKILDDDGNPIEIDTGTGGISFIGAGGGGWEYQYHKTTEEEVQIVRSLIDTAQVTADMNQTVLEIITEEAEPFFQGQKSVDDVVGVIQSRIQLYISENM